MKASPNANGAKDSPDKGETQVFRLLDLPDELWSRIGKMAIDAEAPTDIQRQPKPKLPALLRTCTTLRHELLIYWCANKVRCWSKGVWYAPELRKTGDWLKSLPLPARRSIRSLHISIARSRQDRWLQQLEQVWGSRGIRYFLEKVEPHPLGTREDVWFKIKFL